MRTFTMHREGREVAEGVCFSDDTTVVRWTTPDLPQSTVVWKTMHDALVIHDHDGKTTIEWTDRV